MVDKIEAKADFLSPDSTDSKLDILNLKVTAKGNQANTLPERLQKPEVLAKLKSNDFDFQYLKDNKAEIVTIWKEKDGYLIENSSELDDDARKIQKMEKNYTPAAYKAEVQNIKDQDPERYEKLITYMEDEIIVNNMRKVIIAYVNEWLDLAVCDGSNGSAKLEDEVAIDSFKTG